MGQLNLSPLRLGAVSLVLVNALRKGNIIKKGPHFMSVAEAITRKLTEAFAPSRLHVVDDSEAHRGHAGHRPGGETHFNVSMVSARLDGLSRVAAQRAVHAVLAEELAGPVHALSLDVKGES